MRRGTGQGNAYLGKGFGAAGKAGDEALAKRIRDIGLTVTREWMAPHGVKHKTPSGKAGTNLPLSEGDFELILSPWRHPDGVSVHSKNEITLSMDTFDGGKLVLSVNVTTGSPTTFRKERTAKAPSSAETAYDGRRTFAVTEDNQAHKPPKGKEER